MTNKAISKEFLCDPWKIPFKDRNPYIQVDIDRLIGHLESEIEKFDSVVKNPVGLYEEHPHLLKELETFQHAYEGILSMIRANSFK